MSLGAGIWALLGAAGPVPGGTGFEAAAAAGLRFAVRLLAVERLESRQLLTAGPDSVWGSFGMLSSEPAAIASLQDSAGGLWRVVPGNRRARRSS